MASWSVAKLPGGEMTGYQKKGSKEQIAVLYQL